MPNQEFTTLDASMSNIMVQARQFRKSHEDAHYAAAVFRYQRELAVRFRTHSLFLCMDDKHRIKVGELKHPVAATERGRRVIVGLNETFEVADYLFICPA